MEKISSGAAYGFKIDLIVWKLDEVTEWGFGIHEV